jgi:hypothetical protein
MTDVLTSPTGEKVYTSRPGDWQESLTRAFGVMLKANAEKDHSPLTPDSVPASHKAAMRAKLNRDKQSFRAFRDIDQQLHEQAHQARVQAALGDACQVSADWQEDLAGAEPEAADALARSRAAEDRARAALEHARNAEEAYRKIRSTGTPGEITEALTKAQNALKVAEDEDQAADDARRELDKADIYLAEVRAGLASAEIALQVAGKAAQAPAGTAPYSDATIKANACYMQQDEIWPGLSDADRWRVHAALQSALNYE